MEIKKLNKKASHVGFILSFVIFITSAVFLYTILQPNFQTSFEKQNVLDYLMEKVVSNSTIEYTSISLNSDTAGNCLNFSNLRGIANIGTGLVANNNSQGLPLYVSGDDVVVESNGQTFVKVIESGSFEPASNTGCAPTTDLVNDAEYSIGLTRTQEDVFSSAIIDIVESHDENYPLLKTDLNLPETSDFSLNFTYDNGTSFSSGSVPEGVINIYSDQKSIQYINNEGVKKTGTLQIRVW